MEKRVTIIRHALAIKNLEDRHGGSGSGLAPLGVQEIDQLAERLNAINISRGRLIFSPVAHAEETARKLAKAMSSELEASDLIRPLDFGLVAGLKTEEVWQKHPDIANRLARWRTGQIEAIDLELPGAESFELFWQRGITFLETIPHGHNVVVGTRSVLVLLGNILRGKSPLRGGGYKEIPFKNCEFFTFRFLENSWAFHQEQSSPSEGRF